jgi:DNA-binding protein H-NS
MEAKKPAGEGCPECARLRSDLEAVQRKNADAVAAERLRADNLEIANRALQDALQCAQAALEEQQEQARCREAEVAETQQAFEQHCEQLEGELVTERGVRIAATERGDRLKKRLKTTEGVSVLGGIVLTALALGPRR